MSETKSLQNIDWAPVIEAAKRLAECIARAWEAIKEAVEHVAAAFRDYLKDIGWTHHDEPTRRERAKAFAMRIINIPKRAYLWVRRRVFGRE